MCTKQNRVGFLFALCLVGSASTEARADGANAERLVQSTTEVRTYLHFKVDSAVVRRLLPAGWVSVPGSGALKDVNFSVFLAEGLAASGADGKPTANQARFAVFAVPAKNEQSGVTGAFIVGGFVSQPQGAPGVYGVYQPAAVTVAKSSRSEGMGPTVMEENWEVRAEGGEQITFAVVYERGVGMPGHVEPRIYSTVKPEFYRVYKADQIVDVVHSVPTETKRTRRLDFKATGPQLSKIFDGREELLAIASIPAYSRQIFLPE